MPGGGFLCGPAHISVALTCDDPLIFLLRKILMIRFSGLALFLCCATLSAQTLAVRPRLAIIGLVHSHVWGHLSEMAQMPDADLAGIAEPNQELVGEARKYAPQAEYFTDYKRMIEVKKPQIVWAFVENNRHLEIVEYCAPRKIHVIFEKPLAATYPEAVKIRDLARQHNIQVMTNYQMAWWPTQYVAKQQADSGAIGTVWRLHGIVGHGGPGSEGVRNKYFFEWLTDPVRNGAGALMDFGCYNALWSLWYLGKPDTVYAETNHLRPAVFPKVEDNAVLVLGYRNAVGIFEASWDLPRGFQDLDIFGRSGSIHMTQQRVELRKGRQAPMEVAPVALSPDQGSPVRYMITQLRAGRSLEGLTAVDINVDVNEIIDAAKESARTGKAVKLPLRR
jgi:predicted dehydrogenase